MGSPWSGIESAFDVMYDEQITLTSNASQTTTNTVYACVLTSNTDDPLTEDSIDTDCEVIQILVKESDWTFAQKLRHGDIARRGTKNYRIQKVYRDDVMGLVIKARGE